MLLDITSDLTMDAKIGSTLTNTELKIASLIRTGYSTEEIAKRMNVAPSTVRTHRKKIRKKLKINRSQYSLKNYLISHTGGSRTGR